MTIRKNDFWQVIIDPPHGRRRIVAFATRANAAAFMATLRGAQASYSYILAPRALMIF